MLVDQSYITTQTPEELGSIFGHISQIDQIIVDGKTLTTQEFGALYGLIQQSSLGSQRLFFIKNADHLTDILQNKLLKILEEPNPSLVIFLHVSDQNKILPTVTSRLHRFQEDRTEHLETLDQRLEENVAKLAKQLQNLPDREALITLLNSELRALRNIVLIRPNHQLLSRFELLDRAIVRLHRNTNMKLTIDWILLHWPEELG